MYLSKMDLWDSFKFKIFIFLKCEIILVLSTQDQKKIRPKIISLRK